MNPIFDRSLEEARVLQRYAESQRLCESNPNKGGRPTPGVCPGGAVKVATKTGRVGLLRRIGRKLKAGLGRAGVFAKGILGVDNAKEATVRYLQQLQDQQKGGRRPPRHV